MVVHNKPSYNEDNQNVISQRSGLMLHVGGDREKKTSLQGQVLTLSCHFFFVLKMSSAYYVRCIYSNTFQTVLTLEALTLINPDQTLLGWDLGHLTIVVGR